MERMQAEALEAKAEGIVGVDLHERSHGWGSHVIEFFAIGTAIIPAEGAEDHVIPAAHARCSTSAERSRRVRHRTCTSRGRATTGPLGVLQRANVRYRDGPPPPAIRAHPRARRLSGSPGDCVPRRRATTPASGGPR